MPKKKKVTVHLSDEDVSLIKIRRFLGKRLREIRLKKEMSQQDLAEKISRTQTYVSNLEKGNRRSYDIEDLFAVSKALQYNLLVDLVLYIQDEL